MHGVYGHPNIYTWLIFVAMFHLSVWCAMPCQLWSCPGPPALPFPLSPESSVLKSVQPLLLYYYSALLHHWCLFLPAALFQFTLLFLIKVLCVLFVECHLGGGGSLLLLGERVARLHSGARACFFQVFIHTAKMHCCCAPLGLICCPLFVYRFDRFCKLYHCGITDRSKSSPAS